MEKIQEINLFEIRPSAMNPRKTFDQEALQELADNIRRQGLLQPITVRPVDDQLNVDGTVSRYEVVCGERRYRAFLLNQKIRVKVPSTIPCIVRELTDDEAFDAMITENLQRKDVDPTEEAFAFGELAKRGQTTEEIALRFGKSQRFVLDRIKLNKLIPELMLRVKDGTMALSAAMIICKLDEEQQQKFHSSNSNDTFINKYYAERFCNSLFAYISNSEWVKAKRPEYDGGCGKPCSQCEYNTKNVGCIFYEMKAEDENARCIDKERFLDKKMAFLMDLIIEQDDVIVKQEDATLEFGKTAVILETSYGTQRDKDEVEEFVKMVKAAGYAVFNREDVFENYSWYSKEDERLKEKLANHEIYRCMCISGYYGWVDLTERYYTFKKDLAGADSETITESATVAKLAEKYKKAHDKCLERRAQAYAGLFSWDVDKLNGKPLNEQEMMVLAAYMLRSANWEMRNKMLDNGVMPPVEVTYEYVKKHPDKVNLIIRNHLRELLNEYTARCTTQGDIAASWFPGEQGNIEAGFKAEVEKKCSKFAQELDEMGYTRDGKKKPEKKPRKPKQSTLTEQYNQIKEKHPDAVLLFRVGDFYESYFQDAVTVSNTLGIVLTKRSDDATEMAGFPHHALDKYLPMLTRAGLRVAICDQLETPENTTKRGKK